MNLFIYDSEIKHGIATPENPAQPGYRYARDWNDFAGMGIAVVAGYDMQESRYRVFLEDNLSDFQALIDARDGIIGFNNYRFDDRLSRAHSITIPRGKSYDLAACIWQAAGIPSGEHPRGLGLNALCKANGLPEKTGFGGDAPQDFQAGRIGRVIDYCLNDVRCTLQLLRYVQRAGGCIDPRNGDWLPVTIGIRELVCDD